MAMKQSRQLKTKILARIWYTIKSRLQNEKEKKNQNEKVTDMSNQKQKKTIENTIMTILN
jgi:hypothetical protein